MKKRLYIIGAIAAVVGLLIFLIYFVFFATSTTDNCGDHQKSLESAKELAKVNC